MSSDSIQSNILSEGDSSQKLGFKVMWYPARQLLNDRSCMTQMNLQKYIEEELHLCWRGFPPISLPVMSTQMFLHLRI